MTANSFGDAPGCNRSLPLHADTCWWASTQTITGIDLFVVKLVVGLSGRTPKLQSTSSWRSLLVGFGWHPPAAIDFLTAKLVVGLSGASQGLQRSVVKCVAGFPESTSSWRNLFVGLGNEARQSAGMLCSGAMLQVCSSFSSCRVDPRSPWAAGDAVLFRPDLRVLVVRPIQSTDFRMLCRAPRFAQVKVNLTDQPKSTPSIYPTRA